MPVTAAAGGPEQSQLPVAGPVPQDFNIGVGSVAASHSGSVIASPFPSNRSNTQQPGRAAPRFGSGSGSRRCRTGVHQRIGQDRHHRELPLSYICWARATAVDESHEGSAVTGR
jgi:hypothetical protein